VRSGVSVSKEVVALVLTAVGVDVSDPSKIEDFEVSGKLGVWIEGNPLMT
jgi:hypothetical protein